MHRTSVEERHQMLHCILDLFVKPSLPHMKRGHQSRGELQLYSDGYVHQLAQGWQAVVSFLIGCATGVEALGSSYRLWDQALSNFVQCSYKHNLWSLQVVICGLVATPKNGSIGKGGT